jgi:uncharacterized protein with NRDE domain
VCVLAFDFDPASTKSAVNSDRPILRIISNRDEFLSRPTQAAHWWREDLDASAKGTQLGSQSGDLKLGAASWVLGGRDLRAGGSWLAMSRAGRIAILTNYRGPSDETQAMQSRGNLVEQWVGLRHAHIPGEEAVDSLASSAQDYAGFNLLVFDCPVGNSAPKAWMISNRAPEVLSSITPGVHGLSNEILDSPWPKTETLKDSLSSARSLQGQRFEESCLKVLCRAEPAPDEHLPTTGIPIERERYLSSIFIRPPDLDDAMAYGTRCSTVLSIGQGRAEFLERSYYPRVSERRFSFRLASGS